MIKIYNLNEMPSIILFYFIIYIAILKINTQRNLLEEGLSA